MTIKDLLRYNVAESDGTACDVLLRILGGTNNASKYIHNLGVEDIAIATTEMVQVSDDSIQYQNWATPKAMTKLLQIFYSTNKLSEKSSALLLKDMIESTPGQKRLKGLLPSGTIVAHKPGTAATFNGLTRATNDVGIITLPNGNHLAITVFISDSYDSHPDRELTIAKVSKTAFDFWSKNR
jgi:beta-lactamase class A